MIETDPAKQFVVQLSRTAWRGAVRPFISLCRLRVHELLERFSLRRLNRLSGALLAALVLISGTQAMSPVAHHQAASNQAVQSKRSPPERDRSGDYAWLSSAKRADYVPLADYIAAPAGRQRVELDDDGFADWLRHLPIAPVGTPVTAAGGKIMMEGDDSRLAAVIALQPGNRRLLSGGNMLIRLRAEYAWSRGEHDRIAFHLTSGHCVDWHSWSEGVRPVVDGRSVEFKATGHRDDSRSNFCAYLESLFNYTSHLSLLDDTRPPADATVAPGDILLKSDRKSEPLIVLDAAVDADGGVCLLLGRCGIPAQTLHVIRAADGSPWFPLTQRGSIEFDGASYEFKHLRRWVR